MKNALKLLITKKQLCLVVMVLVASLLAGCEALFSGAVMSAYPVYPYYYKTNDLISDSGLSGRWISTNGVFEITSVADKSYLITTETSDHETNYLNGHLFQLQGQSFLDLCTTNREGWLHIAVKVVRDNNALRLAVFDYDWMKNILEAKPVTLRRLLAQPTPVVTHSSVVFVSNTEPRDLQNFLLKHLNDTNAFTAVVDFKREP